MSTNAETQTPGPDLLNERSLGGIAVHFLALLTGALGAGLVYALASHPYTRENARHALNWHLSVLIVFVVGVATFFLGAGETTVGGDPVDLALVPSPIDLFFAVVGFALLFVAMVATFLTFVFALVATIKAIFGTAWPYPGAYGFVDSDRVSPLSTAAGDDPDTGSTRRLVLVAYVLLLPAVVLPVAWLATGDPPDVLAIAVLLGLLASILLAVLGLAALYVDATARSGTGANWTPTWWLYVGLPPVAGVAVTLAREATGSMNPSGDGMYGFLVVLWVAAVVYLVEHRRRAGRS